MSFVDNLRRLCPKALGLGIINALLLSAVMVPAFLSGISPMPKPPSLAFAETLLGAGAAMPVGLLFHVAYVALWSVIFVAAAHPLLSFGRALALALAPWVVASVVFFPVVGWGFLGLASGPALIVASLVPHVLFAVFLWGLGRLMFRSSRHHEAASQ